MHLFERLVSWRTEPLMNAVVPVTLEVIGVRLSRWVTTRGRPSDGASDGELWKPRLRWYPACRYAGLRDAVLEGAACAHMLGSAVREVATNTIAGARVITRSPRRRPCRDRLDLVREAVAENECQHRLEIAVVRTR